MPPPYWPASHEQFVAVLLDHGFQPFDLLRGRSLLRRRWDSAVRCWLARVSDQGFESAGDHDEEHAAAVVPDGVAVRDVARPEDVVAGVRLDRRVADLEGEVAFEDPEAFVVAVVDVQRHFEAGRGGDFDDRQLTAAVVGGRLDDGEVAEPPARLAFFATDDERPESLGRCGCVRHCSSFVGVWATDRSAIAYRQARSSCRRATPMPFGVWTSAVSPA